MAEAIARRLARFAVRTSSDALPGDVIDRIKAVLFQGLVSAAIGARDPHGVAIVDAVAELEGSRAGVPVLGAGTTVTAPAAAFCGSKLIHRGARLDVYRMLTHPGATILPAAVASAQRRGASGVDLLSALAVGYEVHHRIAGDRIASTQARGFRSSPVFGIFGGIVAAGRLAGLDEDELTTAIAIGAEFASGTLGGVLRGSTTFTVQEPHAARSAIHAVSLARAGLRGAETSLEGDAGFFQAICGTRSGSVAETLDGPRVIDDEDVVEGLGSIWAVPDTSLRLYDAAGYNVPVLERTAALCVRDDIKAGDVSSVEIEVNWHEPAYPSPSFPRRAGDAPRPGGPEYYAAYGVLTRSYPMGRPRPSGPRLAPDEPAGLADLMARVRVIPSTTRPVMAPIVTVRTAAGTTHRLEATGTELQLGMTEAVDRLRPLASALGSPDGFDALAVAVAGLEHLATIDALIDATLKKEA